jgi:hypothetical protein
MGGRMVMRDRQFSGRSEENVISNISIQQLSKIPHLIK